MKTRGEVEILKRQWSADPCFDISETEGFEDYRQELLTYEAEMVTRWRAQVDKKLAEKAEALGVPGNVRLAAAFLALEDRIDMLARTLAEHECKS